MIVVAVETSSLVASFAIIHDDRVLVESTLQIGTVYAEQLPVMLDRAMTDAGIPIERIDGFAVSIGPGSYTGLRVGLSLVKGLAYAAGKPLITVPTLDAVAYGVPYCQHPVCAVLDARRRQVYTAFYCTTNGLPERQTSFRVTPLDDLLETITQPTVFAGPGALVYHAPIKNTLGDKAHFLPDGLSSLRALPVAFLGRDSLCRGEHASLYEVTPLYLQRPAFEKCQPAQSTSSDIAVNEP